MPASAKAYIHYGPYESCGVIEHQIARLEGLSNVLKQDGHEVDMIQINDCNVIEIWVNGEQVFHCDIRDLDYGGDGGLDKLCSEALLQVQRAF